MNIYYELEKLETKVQEKTSAEMRNAKRIIAWCEEWIMAKPVMVDELSYLTEILSSDLADGPKDLKPMMKEEGIIVDSYAISLAEDLYELENIAYIVDNLREDGII